MRPRITFPRTLITPGIAAGSVYAGGEAKYDGCLLHVQSFWGLDARDGDDLINGGADSGTFRVARAVG